MEAVREYLISVIAAAIFCGAIQSLLREKTTVSVILKSLCGVFLCVVVLRPITEIQFDLSGLSAAFPAASADAIVEEAGIHARTEQMQRIKDACEAYICDKAKAFDCELEVEVELETTSPFAPNSVALRGAISPYVKTQLSAWLHDQMGIPPEAQRWIG